MIDTSRLLKCYYGSLLCIGGPIPDIQSPYYSLWNTGQISGNLIDLGNELFFYFLCTESEYIKGRALYLVANWPYRYESKLIKKEHKLGKISYKIAEIAAKKELDSIKPDVFIYQYPVENNP